MELLPLIQYLAFGVGMLCAILAVGFLASMAIHDDLYRR